VDGATALKIMGADADPTAAAKLAYGGNGKRAGPPPCVGRCNAFAQCIISPYAKHCCYSRKDSYDYGILYAQQQAAKDTAGADAAERAGGGAQVELQRDKGYGGKGWTCWQYNRGPFDSP
jgi:hypothetical protein